jgi:zinc protease
MKPVSYFLIGALGLTVTASAQVAKNAVRSSVNGIDLVVLKTGVQDVVTISGTLAAGDSLSPDSNPAIADLAGSMLDKGTTQHDKFAISQMLGDVGARIGFGVGSSELSISGKCLRKDLPLVISLISEQLRSPAFSPEEFAKLKKQIAGQMKRQMEDTDFRSNDAFVRSVYSVGHPNRSPAVPEFLAGVEKATLDEVKAFHKKYYGPATLRLVLVGDVEVAAAQGEVTKSFAGWTGGEIPPRPAKSAGVDAPRDQTVYMPDKTNVSVTWGQATGLRYGDPDALALRIGTAILGYGFTGRLMANVRDKEGLTYGIYSTVASDTFVDGDWRIGANFAPALLEKGIESTKRQLTSWYQDGVTEAELAQRKTERAGSYKVGLSTTSGMAGTILTTLNRDLPLSFIDEYPARVAALTTTSVNAAIKKHLDPEKMVLVKAGTVTGAPAAK